jgi:hypothetical protein
MRNITEDMRRVVDEAEAEVISAVGTTRGYSGTGFMMVEECPVCKQLGCRTNGGYTPRLTLMVRKDGARYVGTVRCHVHGEYPMPEDARLVQDYPELAPRSRGKGLRSA